MTEGPYYLAGEAIRSDITEGRPGTPLRLVLPVVDATTCAPISGATVEIWHADAGGNYSGFGAATSNRTFLRGGQKTDAKGEATFLTIYPGWYAGRATHIHVKVHVGNEVHTGQLFFDESANDAVYATSPYSSRSGSRTHNDEDSIYADGGSQSLVALTPDGSGYVGRLTMGVRAG
jgi:protocatechuate 3,4-dioxygenase beta subunit